MRRRLPVAAAHPLGEPVTYAPCGCLTDVLTVVIGAPAVGKSTVGRLLAQATSRPFVDADERADRWYASVGWSTERLWDRARQVGFERAHQEWEVALAIAVEGLVGEYGDAVLALGAGHSHVTTPGLFGRVARALGQAQQVVLLRPDYDVDEAHRELRSRCAQAKGHTWEIDGVDWLYRWLTDGLDERLATDVVITDGCTPQDVAVRIAALPQHGAAP